MRKYEITPGKVIGDPDKVFIVVKFGVTHGRKKELVLANMRAA